MDNKKIRNKIEKMQITIRTDAEKDSFMRREYRTPHNSYEFTQRLIAAFMEDRLEDIIKILINTDKSGIVVDIKNAEGLSWVAGRLADDTERNAKNLFISMIVIAGHQLSIGNSNNYEFITTIGDAGIRELERTNDYEEMAVITIATCRELVSQFQKAEEQKQYHPLIRQAKDYVFHNLHQKIIIRNMAETLGVNPSYLSQLFREKEGCTIQEYILNERINHAKELLALTNKPIAEICESLCFSSQSAFGKYMKKKTGYTPRQYRNMYNDNFRTKLK